MSRNDEDHSNVPTSSDSFGAPEPLDNGNNMQYVDSDAKQSSAWIRYAVEWRNMDNSFKSRQEVDEHNIDLQAFGQDSSSKLPAFERLSIFWTKDDRDMAAEEANAEVKAVMAATGATPFVYLRIYSVAIIHALRSVVAYYPQQDLSGDIIRVSWPYPVLVHHYDELHRFQEECAQRDPAKACVREKNVGEHVKLLLDFLDTEVMDMVRAEKERNKRGYYTFDWWWVFHRPGTTLLNRMVEGLRWEPGVIHSLSGGIFEQTRKDWHIETWSLSYDGEYLDRVMSSEVKHKFDGEASLENTRIVGHFEELDEDALEDEVVKKQVEYGRTYWDVMVSQTKHHEGHTLKFPHNEVQGTVRVDQKSYYSEGQATPAFMNRNDLRDFTSDCHCRGCNSMDRTGIETSPPFDDYCFITREDRVQLSDHEYFLCPSEVNAFVFKTRSWETLHVKNLSPPIFQRDMIDNLVMDEQRRTTLTSLTRSFARLDVHGKQLLQEPWAADFVGGKGNGLIFLLHGGPGVGKTFTAECIANLLERPLMILTVSDIGTDPRTVERKLITKFKTAKSWDAVLLIDEADVFLAKRSIEDLQRSSLVASFLRAVEFYDGILFLTTNRVGTFDDAILSRVHVQLFYPDLDKEQRHKVWMNFIKKLENDRPSMQVKYAVKEYLRSADMSNFAMNGREIRNAFQTAVALAEHRAEKGEGGKTLVTEEHLQEVIELARSFKMYFDTLHGSEGRRALDRGERLEKFIKAIEEHF